MNPTVLLIIILVLMFAVGLILLLIGVPMAAREFGPKKPDKKTKERLQFLKQYAVELESMKNQGYLTDEMYDKELAWVDVELDELEDE